MRLSEAIRLGSLAIQNPEKMKFEKCAVGMACEAIGRNVTVAHSFRGQHPNYLTVSAMWPWTRIVPLSRVGGYLAQIIGTFDGAVMNRMMTLEALCDTVAKWEGELAAKGINVEQVTMAAELTEPASLTQSIQKELAVEAK